MNHVLGKLVLTDYRPFVEIVARAYLARPDFEEQYVPSWIALIEHIERLFERMQARVRVEFVDVDPYSNYAALRADVVHNRRLKVWTGESRHPVWTPEQNWKFRAVHDYMIHVAGDHGFTLRGEMSSYNRHVKLAPPAAHTALFTEIVGQVCTYFFLGTFGPQKVCKLHGFDYVNVGYYDTAEYRRNFE